MKRPLSMEQWNKLKEEMCDIESTLKSKLGLRNTFGDRIIIKDEVLVYEGEKLLFKSRGHIVNQGLIGIINLLGSGLLSATTTGHGLPSRGMDTGQAWSNKVQYMRVGTGTGVTTGTMTTLVTINTTAPDSQSGAIASPTVGTYRVSWIATWNAGTLPAINVSELGIFLCLDVSLNTFEATCVPANAQFFSRLSDSDGDFTTFLVNTAVPLTIEWRLTFTFA